MTEAEIVVYTTGGGICESGIFLTPGGGGLRRTLAQTHKTSMKWTILQEKGSKNFGAFGAEEKFHQNGTPGAREPPGGGGSQILNNP